MQRVIALLVFLGLTLSVQATAQEPPSPGSAAVPVAELPAPAPAPGVWRHAIFIAEDPKRCSDRTRWCLLGEQVNSEGTFKPLKTVFGQPAAFDSMAATLDFFSQQGWEIWKLETSGLKGATRITLRRSME